LRRFGHDFDDAASYPRASLRAIAIHRELPGMLLRGDDNRDIIMRRLGEIFFPNAPYRGAGGCRSHIKRLFNLLDMDGTYGGWRAELNVSARLGDPQIALPDGDVFHVRNYLAQQPERTAWLADCLPDMLNALEEWARVDGNGTAPARTLKSDVLAEYEARSREAKLLWAAAGGHDVLSLQHDGIVIALRPGLAASAAERELCLACSSNRGDSNSG